MSPSDFPIQKVEVTVTYTTPDGPKKVVHEVDGAKVQIARCTHDIDKQFKPTKDEEGNLLGHEPTGIETLKLNVKYIKEL